MVGVKINITLSVLTWGRVSQKDVPSRGELEGVSPKGTKLSNLYIHNDVIVGIRGEGVKKSRFLGDILYGCPLRD